MINACPMVKPLLNRTAISPSSCGNSSQMMGNDIRRPSPIETINAAPKVKPSMKLCNISPMKIIQPAAFIVLRFSSKPFSALIFNIDWKEVSFKDHVLLQTRDILSCVDRWINSGNSQDLTDWNSMDRLFPSRIDRKLFEQIEFEGGNLLNYGLFHEYAQR